LGISFKTRKTGEGMMIRRETTLNTNKTQKVDNQEKRLIGKYLA